MFRFVKKAIDGLLNGVVATFDDPDDEHVPDVLGAKPVEKAYLDQFITEDEVTLLRRQLSELRLVVMQLQNERNVWKKMQRVQASEHLTAQAMLETQLANTRQVAQRAIVMLNATLKKHAEDPENVKLVEGPDDLTPYDGEPVGIAQEYAENLLKLRADLAGEDTDAAAELDRIAALADGRPDAPENGARALGVEASGASQDAEIASSDGA